MRRSDRLSEIIEIVQDGRLHLARDIAEKLEVSVRTIYRDFDTLVASGVPIDGERGVGYMLREPVFLPPMNLSLTELEALHLGMAIVSEAADTELQRAAAALTKKIDKVATAKGTAPKSWGFGVYPFAQAKIGFEHMPCIRTAIRNSEKLEISYRSLNNKTSTRIVWPLQNAYWGRVWTLTCWCEKRNDFRSFRIDCVTYCHRSGTHFDDEDGKLFSRYLEKVEAEMAQKPNQSS
ncbi:YafY family protein [Cognatiyoonia sp. IB215182]|uniref:helix-turn-helix transcriptional regulator n=1 Tax=Cognatiyoonia sp. IB215182 TaxID=3097353 RepID=UPI002A16BDDF|nr:YafY family protein [Cognatiyoonia sp. IB215182]MDX8350828.1 YafY family protein [Cognatiyoonia sp. IB215182]